MGGKACESGGLASGEGPELGHEGDERCGGLVSVAGDGEEGFDGVGHGRAGFDEGVDVGLEGFDLAGVGAVGGNVGTDEGGAQGVFIASGGFADGEAGGVERGGNAGVSRRREPEEASPLSSGARKGQPRNSHEGPLAKRRG